MTVFVELDSLGCLVFFSSPCLNMCFKKKAFPVGACCSFCRDRTAVCAQGQTNPSGKTQRFVEPETLIKLNNLGGVNAAAEKVK